MNMLKVFMKNGNVIEIPAKSSRILNKMKEVFEDSKSKVFDDYNVYIMLEEVAAFQYVRESKEID